MSTDRLRLAILRLAALLVWVAAAPCASAANRPLPELQILTLDGAALPPGSLTHSGHWLLVYVLPQSASCRSLLQQLDPIAGAGAGNVALIVGGDATQARALTGSFSGLAKATLYLDPTHQGLRDLGLAGVPVVLGMKDAAIEWTLGGALSDPKKLESILKTWLQ
jgi:hypothetical protein